MLLLLLLLLDMKLFIYIFSLLFFNPYIFESLAGCKPLFPFGVLQLSEYNRRKEGGGFLF